MKKTLLIFGAIGALLISLTISNDKNMIVVYTSMEQFRNDKLQEDLNDKFPSKNVRVMYIPTGKAASKLFLEKERTDADIVVGLETSYLEKISDQLTDVSHLSRIDYVDEFKDNTQSSKYIIWERQAGAFLINENELRKRDLDIPTSYEDLLDHKYKGLIAMPDPKSSGTGFFYYQNRVNVLGEENALNYFDDLSMNIKQFTESGSGPIKLLNQGEIAIGLALTFQSVNEINKDRDYKILYPEDGSPYSLTGTSIVKGKEKNSDVLEVFDYIIHDFFIYDKEYFSPESVYNGQKNKVKNYPKNIKYADMTNIEDINEKERLLELWKY